MAVRWSKSLMGKTCCQWLESVLRHLIWLLVTPVLPQLPDGTKRCVNDKAD
jgi:hypothetical protein